MIIGDRLRALHEERNLSQGDIEKRSDINKWDEKQWQAWAAKRGVPVDSSLGKRVREDALQWNMSNESLEQFLSLAKEYWDFWKKEMRTEPRH